MASIRCVRPDFTASAQSVALASSDSARCSSAGTSDRTRASVTATCTDVGKTSFEDCEALTWSFGCTSVPAMRVANVARTSFMFMFDEVPLPVW